MVGWRLHAAGIRRAAGLGITEAAVVMRAVAQSGGGITAASAIHVNIFGLNPVALFGSPEQKQRMLPPIRDGKQKACFAVTEAEHRPQHHAIEDSRRRSGRLLPRERPESVDFHRPNRR